MSDQVSDQAGTPPGDRPSDAVRTHPDAAAPAPAHTPDTHATAPALTRFIRGVLDRLRAFDRRRPRVWDASVTGFWMVAAVLDYTSGGWRTTAHDDVTAPEHLVLLMSLGFSLPLLWRRTHPLAVVVLMAPISAVNVWTGAVVQASLLQLIPVFHLVLRSSLRTVGAASLLFVVPVLSSGARIPSGWGQEVVSYVWGLVFVVLLGIAVRTRREYTEALVERAQRLEYERDQQTKLAAAAERTRIAREMHDIIGHNLSVITGLADGGAYAARKSPERAGQALEAIGTTSRQALSELRRLLGVLRDDHPDADRTPQPTLDELTALIDRVRGAGLPVHLELNGRPTPRPLTPGRQLTVYRVVQEALTNTLKHATRPASATVTLTYSRTHLDARITDTGTGSGGSANAGEAPAAGQGIMGMRERAALYDGHLEAGPLPAAAGWQVRLRLPLEESHA
ncbi:sensor histidine kinase [Streptomyces californicus]|uniref:sensor histidine kinase n=1 Tax=Streptomyces californicus TaxID=67351 RepID=UPI0037A4C7F5